MWTSPVWSRSRTLGVVKTTVYRPRCFRYASCGPNASARSQVHDRVYFFAAKHSSDRIDLSKIDVTNGYVFCETSNVRVLDLRIVKIIEIVQDDDFMPHRKQLLGPQRGVHLAIAGGRCDHPLAAFTASGYGTIFPAPASGGKSCV